MILSRRIIDTLRAFQKINNSVVIGHPNHNNRLTTCDLNKSVFCSSNFKVKSDSIYGIYELDKLLKIAEVGSTLEDLGDSYSLISGNTEHAIEPVPLNHIFSPKKVIEFKEPDFEFTLNREAMRRIKRDRKRFISLLSDSKKRTDMNQIRLKQSTGYLTVYLHNSAFNHSEIIVQTEHSPNVEFDLFFKYPPNLEVCDTFVQISKDDAVQLVNQNTSSRIALDERSTFDFLTD